MNEARSMTPTNQIQLPSSVGLSPSRNSAFTPVTTPKRPKYDDSKNSTPDNTPKKDDNGYTIINGQENVTPEQNKRVNDDYATSMSLNPDYMPIKRGLVYCDAMEQQQLNNDNDDNDDLAQAFDDNKEETFGFDLNDVVQNNDETDDEDDKITRSVSVMSVRENKKEPVRSSSQASSTQASSTPLSIVSGKASTQLVSGSKFVENDKKLQENQLSGLRNGPIPFIGSRSASSLSIISLPNNISPNQNPYGNQEDQDNLDDNVLNNNEEVFGFGDEEQNDDDTNDDTNLEKK